MNLKLVHIYNWWNAPPRILKRMTNAKVSWQTFYDNDKYGVLKAEFSVQKGQRSSADLGETQITPFIKDVINYGLTVNPDCNLFLYTNTDISLVSDASNFIRKTLDICECGYSHRVEFTSKHYPTKSVTRDNLKNILALGSWSAGSDTFFFTRNWWKKHEANLPDALIGFEAWDACFMAYMLRNGMQIPTTWISYHQQHVPYWKKHRLKSPGQLHNRKICTNWAIKNNLSHLINHGAFLFKVPTPYNVA